MSSIVNVTAATFEGEVKNANELVIVDFWATWCGPCRMISPILDEIADEYAGKIKVAKINVDDETTLAESYKVMSIPTILFFKDGNVVEKCVGARSKGALKELIEENL